VYAKFQSSEPLPESLYAPNSPRPPPTGPLFVDAVALTDDATFDDDRFTDDVAAVRVFLLTTAAAVADEGLFDSTAVGDGGGIFCASAVGPLADFFLTSRPSPFFLGSRYPMLFSQAAFSFSGFLGGLK
jgi:hypothetical protein